MAVTKIIKIKKTPKKSLDYVMNPKKAEYISGYNCAAINPSIAHKEFDEVRTYYGKTDKNLQYHVIQSFSSDDKNTSPELVHKIGLAFAEKHFPRFQVVVTTHTDKDHIHNHFMINSVSFLDGLKYNDCDKTYAEIRKNSDQICKEHGLDILEHTTEYSRYANNKKRTVKEADSFYKTSDYRNSDSYKNSQMYSQSFSSKIRHDIDEVISICVDFKDFIKTMKEKGYEIKYGNVKHIAFKSPEQQRFKRGSTLGENYTEEAIRNRINEKIKHKELHSNKDDKKALGITPHKKTVENHQASFRPDKKKSKYKYEDYRYGKTDIDKLDELYKRIKYNDGTVLRIPRAQIETIFIKDLKETEAKRKKIRSMLNDNSSSYIIKINKVKEKELIDRINNNFTQLKFIERNEITGFDDINENIIKLKNQHHKIRDKLSSINRRLNSMEKMHDIIVKYQSLTDSEYKAKNAEEFDLLKDCEDFLKEKKLSSRIDQDEFVAKYIEHKNKYTSIKNLDILVEKKMKEYDILIMTLQYIDKHGKDQNRNNFNNYYSIRNDEHQK